MKKVLSLFSITLMFALAFSIVVASASAAAGGGKVRGEEGTGSVLQNCVHPDGSDTCPFVG